MNTNKKTERILEDVQIKLSALWVAIMLTYLLGSVIKIFVGDFVVGEIDGIESTQIMWLGLAIWMMIPVVMVFLSLTSYWSRGANIISAILFFGLNLMGLPGSPSAYEIFLITVMLVFIIFIFGYAWTWSKQEGRVHS